eukprot:7554832-Pyramimonas_sp.AAC.1
MAGRRFQSWGLPTRASLTSSLLMMFHPWLLTNVAPSSFPPNLYLFSPGAQLPAARREAHPGPQDRIARR